ncbi:baseplate hub protein [Advenella sp. RU8]|uniref:baseplate hub protein n=1 Tax=Advenella sp. RU8 TaxID=3399575 RepID=UPI003AAC213D
MTNNIKQYLRKWSMMINGEPFIDARDGHQFRCVFDIQVRPGGSSMIAEFHLYNLSKSTVINQRSDISFSAGYSDNFSVLFNGSIVNIMRGRRGPDVITSLFCRSSTHLTRGSMYGAYGQGAHVTDVLRDVARSWPLYLDMDPSQFDEKDVFPAGWTASTDPQATLESLKKMFGFHWTVENGSLVITRINKERSTTMFDINQSNGMVGMPELIGIEDGIGVEVTTKINPLIRASSRINVKSEFTSYQTGNLHIAEMDGDASANGEYNVFKMSYFGDSHGNAWDMRILGFRAGSQVLLPINTGGSLIWGKVVEPEFRAKVREIAQRQGLDPNWYMAVMAFETGGSFSPSVPNAKGSGATGLIQFMPNTAKGLGTSTAALASMTRLQQLDYVEKYFDQYKSRIKNLGDMYMAVFMPAKGIGKPDSTVLIDRDTWPTAYNQNSSLDKNDDGKITRGEAVERVNLKAKEGQGHMA